MSILQTIKEQFKEWNNPGVNVPLANDQGVPSMTLLFAYLSFLVTLLSLIYLHIYPDKPTPTLISIMFWSISLIIYRLRRIDKFSIDLDDKSLSLEASDDKEEPKK